MSLTAACYPQAIDVTIHISFDDMQCAHVIANKSSPVYIFPFSTASISGDIWSILLSSDLPKHFLPRSSIVVMFEPNMIKLDIFSISFLPHGRRSITCLDFKKGRCYVQDSAHPSWVSHVYTSSLSILLELSLSCK